MFLFLPLYRGFWSRTQGNFDANNLITNTVDNTNQLLNVNDLTGDFGQAAANASTSTASPYDQNLTIAKYNKTTSNDDIMRIASQ